MFPMMARGALLIAVSVSLVSCAKELNYDVRSLNRDQSYWFNYDASRRGAILAPKRDQNDLFHMCAEPSPDVALQTAIKQLTSGTLSADTSKGQLQVEANREFASKVVELASRTQTILFLREAMYRLCEQQMNGALSAKDAKSLYEAVVETSITLAEAQVIETLSRIGNTDQAKALLQVFVEAQLSKRRLEQQERKILADEQVIKLFKEHAPDRTEELDAYLASIRRLNYDLKREADRLAEERFNEVLGTRLSEIRSQAKEEASRAIEEKVYAREEIIRELRTQLEAYKDQINRYQDTERSRVQVPTSFTTPPPPTRPE
jgi:hypothetical protein